MPHAMANIDEYPMKSIWIAIAQTKMHAWKWNCSGIYCCSVRTINIPYASDYWRCEKSIDAFRFGLIKIICREYTTTSTTTYSYNCKRMRTNQAWLHWKETDRRRSKWGEKKVSTVDIAVMSRHFVLTNLTMGQLRINDVPRSSSSIWSALVSIDSTCNWRIALFSLRQGIKVTWQAIAIGRSRVAKLYMRMYRWQTFWVRSQVQLTSHLFVPS